MATISKSGIESGKIIKSEHLIRIINALAASSSADIKVSGSVSSSLFYGDGRYLTNISASNITNVLEDVQPWHVPYLNGNANAFENSPIHVTSSLVNGAEVYYVAINTTASFEIESRAPEALLVYQDNPDSYTVIRGEGLVDNYFQIDVKNFNTGSSASSDLVATANNGTESDMYVNVGINNEEYAVEGTLGGPNDVYVYGLGQKMVIGNARSGASGSVTIFAGGFDTEIYKKLFIDPNDRHQMTGSLSITGTLTSKQGVKITGSLNITGSTVFEGIHTLSGSNTITGNTVLSGSIEVSGSSNFHNSIFIVTGSAYFTGSHYVDGNSVFSGSINIASGSSYYRAGNKLFNYGQWGSLETQSGSLNTAYAMKLGTQFDGAEGVYIANNGSGFPTRVTVQNTGLYNIQFSAQLHTTANEACDFSVWFAMTGSNIENSNTDFSIEKVAGGGYAVAALNFLTPIQANDWIELYWSKTTSNGQLQYKGTQSTPARPATPSIIVTVTQIA